MTDSSDEEDVGYGKPPKDSQFTKGKSGNPAGRPKGSSRLSYLRSLTQALEREITITEKGERIDISMLDGITRRLVNEALNGKPTAMRLVIDQFNNFHDQLFDPPEVPKQQYMTIRFVAGRDENGELIYSDTLPDRGKTSDTTPEPKKFWEE
jgi:hypothetical protein